MLPHDIRADRVEFGGRDSWAHLAPHGFEHEAHYAAGRAHTCQFLRAIDRHDYLGMEISTSK
jgi:hypothetical protein